MDPAPFKPSHPVLHTLVIWHPKAKRDGFVSVLFRRRFTLPEAVRNVTMWVSASQRYILYLDGEIISRGPSRSDPHRWGCVPVRVKRLRKGRHVLAANVFHFGEHGGKGQLGGPAFFLLTGQCRGADISALVDTGSKWRTLVDSSRTPVGRSQVGCGDRVDGRKASWGWEKPAFADASWPDARIVLREIHDPWGNRRLRHELRPDPLPALEESVATLVAVSGMVPVTVPPRSRVRIVLDRGELTNAYPVLTVSGGNGSRIRMVSAESPFGRGAAKLKGNRDDIEGKVFRGQVDEFLPDGGARRTFTTLWFRSFRYLELTIRTGPERLVVEDVHCRFTGYPMHRRTRFAADAAHRRSFSRIWETSWRTQRLCSHETFFDCPHYEQGQFPGDSRIQAIFHYTIANDDRLARKAIDDFHASRNPDGLINSHYPLNGFHYIPTYSLYWIGMLHDFLLYRGDREFLRPYVPFAREVLEWFKRRVRSDGMLGHIEYAPFMDWAASFKCGNPPQAKSGGSSILTMLYARACGWQARLEQDSGFAELAPQYGRMGRSVACAALRRCWCDKRRLLADTPRKRSFSLHAQVEGTLAGAWSAARARSILRRAVAAPDVTPAGTFYYRYYQIQALKRAENREAFFELLPDWERCLEGTGLTTWPETVRENSRSDCHGWSVTPAIEFVQTVLGIEPAAPGFSEVRCGPALGPLSEARGAVATPAGVISVHVCRMDGRPGLAVDLESPVPVTVAGRRRRPGKHRVTVGATGR